MSAVDPNLSSVIVIPAGDGASLPVTAADDLLDGASPDRFFTTADDGRGQLRIVLRDGRPTVYQSEDSGANWRPIYAGAMAFPSASPWAYTRVSFNLYQGAAPGGTVTAQWSGVSVAVAL